MYYSIISQILRTSYLYYMWAVGNSYLPSSSFNKMYFYIFQNSILLLLLLLFRCCRGLRSAQIIGIIGMDIAMAHVNACYAVGSSRVYDSSLLRMTREIKSLISVRGRFLVNFYVLIKCIKLLITQIVHIKFLSIYFSM